MSAEPVVTPSAPPARGGGKAAVVAAAIFLSRIAGLVRERVIATSFGSGMHADIFSAALRIPNVIQNLLGEGTLTASFVPVYGRLVAQGRNAEAGRVAGALFALLLAVAAAVSLLGLLTAPGIVAVLTPGFSGTRRELMIGAIRLLFPMVGFLVLSAWALSILNSHRQFFVPYVAPVLWNAAIVAGLLIARRHHDLDAVLTAAAWGALVGGVLQFVIQLPWVLRVNRDIRINTELRNPHVVMAMKNAGPAILGRGAVQLSGYVDLMLASLLAVGAVARLRYAQTLYMLPFSLIAASIAAVELAEMSREASDLNAVRVRAEAATRRIAFLIVPSALACIALGGPLVTLVYQGGAFSSSDVPIVWAILAVFGVGMLASTQSRIYQSAMAAMHDTATPARIATLRIIVATGVSILAILLLEPVSIGGLTTFHAPMHQWQLGNASLGPLGIAFGSSCGAWLEWLLLHAALTRKLGHLGHGRDAWLKSLLGATIAAAAGVAVYLLANRDTMLFSFLAVGIFGTAYLAITFTMGLPEARELVGRFLRRAGGRAR
ncbi:MAG TPA: murein biosynthesis integral membrane protein MurJ [Steroidobacteraceae bacterium]|nr:murein biosynthesis integral membrane protein MurJ [Steroidobacteraceae bacterium]